MIHISKKRILVYNQYDICKGTLETRLRKWARNNKGKSFFYIIKPKNIGKKESNWSSVASLKELCETKAITVDDIKWGFLDDLVLREYNTKTPCTIFYRTPKGTPSRTDANQLILLSPNISIEELLTSAAPFARIFGQAMLKQQEFVIQDNIPKKIFQAMEESSTSEYVQAFWSHCKDIGYKTYRNFYHEHLNKEYSNVS